MIHILGDRDDSDTTEIVKRAFERSFTRGQVSQIESLRELPADNVILVALSPPDTIAGDLERLAARSSKIVLLGALGPQLASLAGVEIAEAAPALATAARCAPAATYATSESDAALVYDNVGPGAVSPLRIRHFARFDFTDEWNNLGFGRIGVGEDRWSIRQVAHRCATAVARIVIGGQTSPGAAVTLRDTPTSAVLWFARPVGPVDGQDWAVIESFVSAHRSRELPWRPHLRGIPHGYCAAVTMRLDCDEDVASARALFDGYRRRNLPLSLAIKTGQPEHDAHIAMMADVVAGGGAILSHSVTHEPHWGGSAEAAEREARDSRLWLEQRLPGLAVRYAVSPFHQNPRYVPAALARAGLSGFIGGTISSDPEYLLARGGVPPFGPTDIVTHSQSCMLHGDCMLADGDPLRIPKAAFLLARDFGEFFGFLDHPFSERYAYGWASEAARIAVHSKFLDFIAANADESSGLLFVNEDTCLDFIRSRAAAEIAYDAASQTFAISQTSAAGFPLSVACHGRSEPAHGTAQQ